MCHLDFLLPSVSDKFIANTLFYTTSLFLWVFSSSSLVCSPILIHDVFYHKGREIIKIFKSVQDKLKILLTQTFVYI